MPMDLIEAHEADLAVVVLAQDTLVIALGQAVADYRFLVRMPGSYISARIKSRCNERRFRQLKGPSVPLMWGSVPLTHGRKGIRSCYGPLLVVSLFVGGLGPSIVDFRRVPENIGPQLA